MKPTETLAEHTTRDGEELILYRRDGVYHLRVNGLVLMSSRTHGSEDALARLGCEAIAERTAPRVLIGGLGFGYTLRAALDRLPRAANVVVCEVFELLIEWNGGQLGDLAGRPLEDPRVTTVRSDIGDFIKTGQPFDAILLDVDNGPWAFTLSSNESLYTAAGLTRLAGRLVRRGILAVWSASDSPDFSRRLGRAGFQTSAHHVRARNADKGPRDVIFLGRRS